MKWPADPFWEYALDLYGRPGVEAACLALQARHDVDVNLLLLACWLADRGIALDRPAVARAERAVGRWRDEVVRPLRALRQRLKSCLAEPDPGSATEAWPDLVRGIRERVLALEIDAERVAQLGLRRAIGDLPGKAVPGPALAGVNLRACYRFARDDRSALETLLDASFPGTAPEDLARSLAWLDP